MEKLQKYKCILYFFRHCRVRVVVGFTTTFAISATEL